MADLTADAYIQQDDGLAVRTQLWVLDNSAAQTVYKGQPMIMDLSEDTVYIRGFVDATVVAATDIFIGIAAEGAAVATTDTEIDNRILVYTYPTVIGFKSAVFTDADVGDTMYMSDSGTLSATAADNPQIGKLDRVSDGTAWVQLSAPTICAGA